MFPYSESLGRVLTMYFVCNVMVGNLHSLLTRSLNICAKQGYRIACPTDTALIITNVTQPSVTTCIDPGGCPGAENLKDTLLRSCFGSSVCDTSQMDAVCSFYDGELTVESACVKVDSIIRGCTSGETQLSPASGPLLVITPGYPETYSATQDCSNTVTLRTDVLNAQLHIAEMLAPDVNVYACGSDQVVEIHFHYQNSACPPLLSQSTFEQATTIVFVFHKYSSESRGIILEVTADNVIQDGNIVPSLVEPGKEVQTEAMETSFFTPLVIAGIAGGGALVLLVSIIICVCLCACCCGKKATTPAKNQKKKAAPASSTKANVDKVKGAEAFFAGAKPEPVYKTSAPHANNNNTRNAKDDRVRNPASVTRTASRHEDTHVYQNTGTVHAVTVRADVHRQNSRPRSRKKPPMKLPRKSKAPSAELTPIYENQGGERRAAYENVVFASQERV